MLFLMLAEIEFWGAKEIRHILALCLARKGYRESILPYVYVLLDVNKQRPLGRWLSLPDSSLAGQPQNELKELCCCSNLSHYYKVPTISSKTLNITKSVTLIAKRHSSYSSLFWNFKFCLSLMSFQATIFLEEVNYLIFAREYARVESKVIKCDFKDWKQNDAEFVVKINYYSGTIFANHHWIFCASQVWVRNKMSSSTVPGVSPKFGA